MRYLAVIGMLVILASSAGAQMSREEIVVRTAYAKLSFAVDVNTVYTAVQANPKIDVAALIEQVKAQSLHFKLSDFSVGNLGDVAGEDYDVLGQYPDGQDVIATNFVNASRTEVPSPVVSSYMATAAWTPGPAGRAPYSTVGQMLPLEEEYSGISPLRRYCMYTVTATLSGRSRTYRASFLFGGMNQAAPADVVAALGGGAMAQLVSHPVYPEILLRTSLWKTPAVRGFLLSTQRSEPSCKAGTGDVCCNPENLSCGVASADLRRQQ